MRTSFRVSVLNAAVLLHNVVQCPDAENDSDRTVNEIVRELDSLEDKNGYITRSLLESALYCCNMEHEKLQFWHPQGKHFAQFLRDLLPPDTRFNRYYNVLRERKLDVENT